MTDTFLSARWENLIMANYEVNTYVLTPYLPKGIELDFYNERTYVNLVGLMFKITNLYFKTILFMKPNEWVGKS